MNDFTFGIIFGLIALLSNGFAGALTKNPSKVLGANRLIFYRNTFNSIFLFLILLFTLNQSNFSLKWILVTIAISIFGYFPMFFFYKAMALGKIGVVSPISSSNAIIAVLLSIIFFNESLTWIQSASVFSIILGIILISINFREFERSQLLKISSGIPYALLAALGWGIWSVLVKSPVQAMGPYLTSFIMESTALVMAYFILRGTKEELKVDNKKVLLSVIPISILMVVWSLVYYQGIKVSSVSILAPLSSASPLVVALYGKFKYKETLSAQQCVGIAIILLSVAILSL